MKSSEFYDFEAIEKKWQERWEAEGVFRAGEDLDRKHYYLLEMFPYPSGRAHMGHVRNYSIGDAFARYMWMRGYNVLHPMGFDAFGLPAENAAIKHKIHPETWTFNNIREIRDDLKRLGFAYDWSREVITCLPKYYRWNQWFFNRMLERGLAYRGLAWVNWCPKCSSTLANEQVVNGRCWRHEETPVEQRKLEQWYLKITAYAEELLADTYKLEGWPERVLIMQRNWIGKSEGAEIDFPIVGKDKAIRIFTTRLDTIYGANAVLMSPEHPMLGELIADGAKKDEALAAAQRMINQVRLGRGETDKEGFFTGSYARNPFSGEALPVWVANFVLMEYGTGAVMAVPGHDQRDLEFSRRYRLPVRIVIQPRDGKLDPTQLNQAFEEYGRLVNSGQFSGLLSEEALVAMAEHARAQGFGRPAVSYRLKDWLISRQRFWGTPIPVIYCEGCGTVPVPDDQLPVILPHLDDFEPRGGSPLLRAGEFVNAACPRCGRIGKRETDTMDTFVDSSWYMFRYADPHNDRLPFRREPVDYWLPVDYYIGGITHATLHLIYMRFFTKVMRDLGLVKVDEPVVKLFTQGMVTMGGKAMSKSRGNLVNPGDILPKYGADTLRLFILFAAPPENDLEWSDQAIDGLFRFLNRVYRMVMRQRDRLRANGQAQLVVERISQLLSRPDELRAPERRLIRKLHQTIRRVSTDVEERLHLNTAISALMELVNEIQDYEAQAAASDRSTYTALLEEALEKLVLMLSPFTPHICEEMWEHLGKTEIIARAAWPEYDPRLAAEEKLEIVVQVSGKLRGRILASPEEDEETIKSRALSDPKIEPHIAGRNIAKVVYVPKRLVNIVVS